MGVVQSVAQGVVNKVQVRLEFANISDIPDGGDDPVVKGFIKGTMDLTNNDILGKFASTRAATATLEMPVVEGVEEYAGVFGHFQLPTLDIGMGMKQHNFTADLILTNRTTMVMWTLGMAMFADKGIPLNIRGDPVVSVAGVDPVTFALKLDKQLNCVSLIPPDADSNGFNSTGVLDPVTMTCEYVGPAPAREEGICSISDDCHSTMSEVCVEDGGSSCSVCLALNTQHLMQNGCSSDPLQLAHVSNCFCGGECGVSSHCFTHMTHICRPSLGPWCDVCIDAHMADMMLIGGCGPLKSLATQMCYCYGHNVTSVV
jgi:hypothetical protein